MPSFDLGPFEATSGTLLVSDPGYPRDEDLGLRVPDVQTGTWRAFVWRGPFLDWGEHVWVLAARHERHAFEGLTWAAWGDPVTVDSGQAGIFEATHFGDDSLVAKNHAWGKDEPLVPERPWYSLNCQQTLSEKQAGVIPFGAVSSSGLGDGVYGLLLGRTESGKVVAVALEFLSDDGDE